MNQKKIYSSWGNYPKSIPGSVKNYFSEQQIVNDTADETTFIPFGNGRSYGDVCLNNDGVLLDTQNLNHFLQFDENTGVLKCESGVLLDDILSVFVPRGWFLPVLPGTKYITLGGAVANDVHGKNHHVTGSLGCHVISLDLLRSDGKIYTCSLEENADLFKATIGGLGLTGLILSIELQLKRIKSAFLDVDTIKFSSLEEFFKINEESVSTHEYTAAWVDCQSSGKALGRGVYFCANHTSNSDDLSIKVKKNRTVPFMFPNFVLNRFSISAFNNLYFHKFKKKQLNQNVYYDDFFFPLDGLLHWNRIYGKRGFVQYQCVVPFEDNQTAIREILKKIAEYKKGSFLSVLKTFGSVESPGMLSFPQKGVTLALDFPLKKDSLFPLLDDLDKIVMNYGGKVYPAKDARMSPEAFKAFFPGAKQFERYIDKYFSSNFWRRVMGGSKS